MLRDTSTAAQFSADTLAKIAYGTFTHHEWNRGKNRNKKNKKNLCKNTSLFNGIIGMFSFQNSSHTSASCSLSLDKGLAISVQLQFSDSNLKGRLKYIKQNILKQKKNRTEELIKIRNKRKRFILKKLRMNLIPLWTLLTDKRPVSLTLRNEDGAYVGQFYPRGPLGENGGHAGLKIFEKCLDEVIDPANSKHCIRFGPQVPHKGHRWRYNEGKQT